MFFLNYALFHMFSELKSILNLIYKARKLVQICAFFSLPNADRKFSKGLLLKSQSKNEEPNKNTRTL